MWASMATRWNVSIMVVGTVLLVWACNENPAEVDIGVEVPPDAPCDTTCPPAKPDTIIVTLTDTLFRNRIWWCFAHEASDGPHWECVERDSPPPDSFP